MRKPNDKRPRWRRRALWLGLLLAGALGLWTAIHRVSWLGPMLADGARAIVGPGPVAWAENTAYGLEDRWKRLWHAEDEAPQAYWDVPAATAAPPPPAEKRAAREEAPRFRLADVGPVHTSWSAPGDGVWVPLPDPRRPEEPPRMLKTLLHPDRQRSWAAVSIVAVDLRQVDLHLVAGRYEPESVAKGSDRLERTGVIDPRDHPKLLAAFNGGFKTVHGRYGMRVDGVTLVPPRKAACAVARLDDGRVLVRSWENVERDEARMAWWRQAPACLVEQGQTHVGLTVEDNTLWGSKIGGDTVIRRSAIGVGADGRVLYVAIGDSVTATALTRAMTHAGARDAAELDVNWSFPKFVLYEPRGDGSRELVAKPLCQGFEFTEGEYVRDRSARDFFYLTRKSTASANVD